MKIGSCHQHFLIVLDKDLFEALDEFREKWIGYIGNDETVGAAPAIFERRSVAIGKELKLVDDAANAVSRGGSYLARSINNA
jgi:hypothetical protein